MLRALLIILVLLLPGIAAAQQAIGCNKTAVYDASASGSSQMIAAVSGKAIYVCGYTILSAGTVNVKFVSGTGSNCATGPTNLTPAFQLTAQVGAVDGSQYYRGLGAAASKAFCINASAGVAVQALVYYAQF